MGKNNSGLHRAIEAAGSAAELARRIGIAPQAVTQWDEVPLKRVLIVEKVTGVPREILRPDMYQRAAAR